MTVCCLAPNDSFEELTYLLAVSLRPQNLTGKSPLFQSLSGRLPERGGQNRSDRGQKIVQTTPSHAHLLSAQSALAPLLPIE